MDLDQRKQFPGTKRVPTTLPFPLAALRPRRPNGSKQLLTRQPRHPLVRKLCSLVVQSEASVDSGHTVRLEVPGQPLQYGEQLKAVGEHEALGCWVLDNAPLFKWGEGNDWLLEVDLPLGESPFKLAIVRDGGSTYWEEGYNRTLLVSAASEEVLHVQCAFGDTSSTHVTGVAAPMEHVMEEPGAEPEGPVPDLKPAAAKNQDPSGAISNGTSANGALQHIVQSAVAAQPDDSGHGSLVLA